jgi:YD repeat-containing protein
VWDPRSPLPVKALLKHEWDGRGNPVGITNGAGERTTFVPRGDGRVREARAPDGSVVRYDYTSGAPSRQALDDDQTTRVVTTLDPDAAGRPRRGTAPFGEETEWIWSADNRLERVVRDNDGRRETVRYGYDSFGRVREMSNGQRRSLLAYDAQGFVRRVSDFALDRSLDLLTGADLNDLLAVWPGRTRPGDDPARGQSGAIRLRW